MSALPEFYTVVNRLIAEIAKERGENPEDFKETLLAKIRTGAEGVRIRTPTSSENTRGSNR